MSKLSRQKPGLGLTAAMPHFFAPFTRHTNTAGDQYALEIMPPDQGSGSITAVIAETLHDTMMAEQLASSFGAKNEGDEIQISIRQFSHKTWQIHQFDPIAVQVVRFADPARGPNYCHIGICDLQQYFDVYHYAPTLSNLAPAMMGLIPLQGFGHWCRALVGRALP